MDIHKKDDQLKLYNVVLLPAFIVWQNTICNFFGMDEQESDKEIGLELEVQSIFIY